MSTDTKPRHRVNRLKMPASSTRFFLYDFRPVTLYTGMSTANAMNLHQHSLQITAADSQRLRNDPMEFATVLTTTAIGHQHTIRVRNRKNSSQNCYKLNIQRLRDDPTKCVTALTITAIGHQHTIRVRNKKTFYILLNNQ